MVDVNGLQVYLPAVFAATAAGLIIAAVWYATFFAKSWAREMGREPAPRPRGRALARNIVLSVLASFLFAWVLAFYVAGWRLLPGNPSESGTLTFALSSAFSVWAGFFLPINLSRVLREKHSWRLFLINGGYHLVATAIVVLILAYWT